MHVTDWATAQKEDSKLDAVLQRLKSKKKTHLRTLLGECVSSEEGQMIWKQSSKFNYPPRDPLPMLHPKRGE